MAASTRPRPVANAAASAGARDAEALIKTAERAAIVEFASGVPREWAEGFAQRDPDRPPGDVPPQRWQRFTDDIGRFLDSGFAMQASGARLGTVRSVRLPS